MLLHQLKEKNFPFLVMVIQSENNVEHLRSKGVQSGILKKNLFIYKAIESRLQQEFVCLCFNKSILKILGDNNVFISRPCKVRDWSPNIAVINGQIRK